MFRALAVSVAFHGVLVAVSAVAWVRSSQAVIIPDLNRTVAFVDTRDIVIAEDTAAVEPEPEPEPAPEPDVIPEPLPDVMPEPPRRDAQRPPLPEAPLRSPPESFDARIRRLALLDKTPRQQVRPAPAPRAARLTMSEEDALRTAVRQRMATCWRIFGGLRDSGDLAVRIKVFLGPNGVMHSPEVMDRARLTSGDAYFRLFASHALNAVRKCDRVELPANLPPEKYEAWRELELRFDPSGMLGG